jgi:tetratricopeptide (TPR) repeat protein
MSTVDEQPVLAESTVCAACGLPVNEQAKGTLLCGPCRSQFIAYPIPVALKIFGGLLLCVLLFSLLTLPKNIQTGIHYKRGLVALEKKNFMTAETEFNTVLEKEPDYLDARCRVLIASFYNHHFPVFISTSESLENKKIEDEELFTQMQSLVTRASSFFPKDSFVQIMQRYKMDTDSVPEPVYKAYLAAFPEDDFASSRLAGIFFQNEQYKEADSITNRLLQTDPFHYTSLVLKASMKREQRQLDSSHYYLRRLLDANHQDVVALSSSVRTLLKEKKDAEALALAKEAVALDGTEAYALVSLAMAHHFNKDVRSRDAVLQQLAKDTTAVGMLTYAQDVISGKESFRN